MATSSRGMSLHAAASRTVENLTLHQVQAVFNVGNSFLEFCEAETCWHDARLSDGAFTYRTVNHRCHVATVEGHTPATQLRHLFDPIQRTTPALMSLTFSE